MWSLRLAKLHVYGFDQIPTKYLKHYFNHGKQKIKINKAFNNWENVLHGVPQGSILVPLVFNVFLCDVFLFSPNTDLVSYTDDNTPYAMGSSEQEVINESKGAAESRTLWFQNNCMKVNPDKFMRFICHIIFFAHTNRKYLNWDLITALKINFFSKLLT